MRPSHRSHPASLYVLTRPGIGSAQDRIPCISLSSWHLSSVRLIDIYRELSRAQAMNTALSDKGLCLQILLVNGPGILLGSWGISINFIHQ